MPNLSDVIARRHTTRLMDGEISSEHEKIILDSARRAPSKNKIYGYKVFALGTSDKATELKQQLCDEVTKCQNEKNQTVYLLQTKAPLVLVYMANPAPEHQMVDLHDSADTEIFDRAYSEVKDQISRYVMIKNSIRDAMISAAYAQLTAEDLGYGTAYVACGLEDLMRNSKFIDLFKEEFGDNFKNEPIEPVVLVCIGPKHQKIKDIISGQSDSWRESYLDGETHYKRNGREESFFINKKQETMIIKI